jgi:hypothetical protein
MKRRRKDGDEQDLFSRRWRHWINWKPGERARIRRQVHKRERREGMVLDIWIGDCCLCVCTHDHEFDPTLIAAQGCVSCKWCMCTEHRKDQA